MAELIYKLFITKSLTPLQFSDEARSKLMKKNYSNLADVGAKEIVHCIAFGERWERFGITQFPDIEAVKKREQFIRQFRQEIGMVVDSMNLMGFKGDGDLEIDPDKPIFKAFLTNIGKHKHPEENSAKRQEVRRECGVKVIIRCRSIYQDWGLFGVSQYPDIESVDKHHQMLFEYQRDNNIIWDDMTILGYKAE